MTSARLVLAAQTNGAKSRGPKTVEGKRRSAANSRRHGLYSAKITPDAECQAEFRELLPSLMGEYRPASAIQRRIVESLARSIAGIHWTWRETGAAFERGLLDHPDPSQPIKCRVFDVFAGQSSLLARIDTIERRFTREWRAAVALLESRPKEASPKVNLRETNRFGPPPCEIENPGNEPDAGLSAPGAQPPATIGISPPSLMFDNLSDKLQRVFKNLRGEGRLTAENMEAALREVRVALLEADVNFKVVKQLIEAVRTRSMGQEVLTSLTPSQQIVGIINEELIKVLGSHESRLRFANEPPSVFLIVGLQGSGKTTSTGKLARWLTKNGHRPEVVSVDVYRPAARQQLAVIARDNKIPIYAGIPEEKLPVDLARSARRDATNNGRDVLLVDTAGRLHIDDQLMEELQQLKILLNPVEILFVADAMTGQDAVKSADEFHKRLGITGVILTKMDGDARGGAALSIRYVTGQPLKFVGLGEKADAFEQFHPDRAASRILGMGDIVSFYEKAQEAFDSKEQEEMQRKLIENEFTLEDFRDQLKSLRKLGSLESILKMMPKVGMMKELQNMQPDEKELTRIVAIIDSMTPKERANHMIINGTRRRRIARGSGTSVQDVNNLLKQYGQARKMMKSLSGNLGFLGKKMGKLGGLGKLGLPGF
jgi:signal recognition particle subunit SRP54